MPCRMLCCILYKKIFYNVITNWINKWFTVITILLAWTCVRGLVSVSHYLNVILNFLYNFLWECSFMQSLVLLLQMFLWQIGSKSSSSLVWGRINMTLYRDCGPNRCRRHVGRWKIQKIDAGKRVSFDKWSAIWKTRIVRRIIENLMNSIFEEWSICCRSYNALA